MPKKRNVISLQDMKRCRMTPIFFDTFFNLEKYLDHEQRDPFASNRDVDEDGNEVNKPSALSFYVTKTVLVGPKWFWSDQIDLDLTIMIFNYTLIVPIYI